MSNVGIFLRVTGVNIFICFSVSSNLNHYKFIVSRCLLIHVLPVLLGSLDTVPISVCIEQIAKVYITLWPNTSLFSINCILFTTLVSYSSG
jgi:hypothetical protein